MTSIAKVVKDFASCCPSVDGEFATVDAVVDEESAMPR